VSRHRKSRHRVPALDYKCDPISPEYQSEVDRSVSKLEARYRKAQKALQVAESRAERARCQADLLARKQVQADLVAANRLENEQRLGEYINRIKQAAKNARVAYARDALERQRIEATARRDAESSRRREAAREARDRQALIVKSRAKIADLETEAAERLRELNQIERLMMPGNYAGRSHRAATARHTHGA